MLLSRFIANIKENSLFGEEDKLLLAVSGGVDSVVLCDLCKLAGYNFIIAHCNFRLRGAESDRDEQFVKKLAEKYGVPFYVKSFDTKAIATEQKRSVEEMARDLRYAWFYELLDINTSPVKDQLAHYILTAHHADDNIETIVMKFFRGTGIKGLRGIQPVNKKIIRPLLFARRKEIEDHAWQNKLEYVTDSTNLETVFTRNFFRNRIIPEVNKFFPETDRNLLNNTKRFREAEELYRQAIAFHKSKLLERKGNEVHIPVLKLKKASPLSTIVYEIISEFGFSSQQTDEVIALLGSDSGRYVASASHRVIRNRGWLIIAPLATEMAATIMIEETDQEIVFGDGKLVLRKNDQQPATGNRQQATGNDSIFLDAGEIRFPLLLRKWKPGDYFYPLGMKKKKKISRFLIDMKLSATKKEKVWVLESDKRIIWVIGYRIDERFKLVPHTQQVLKLSVTDFQTG